MFLLFLLSGEFKFEERSRSHRTGKDQFSFQSQRKAIPKNAQTSTQLHSSHTLVKYCSKSSKPGFHSTWTMNLDVQAGFSKGRRTRDQIVNLCWIIEKVSEFQKIIYFCFLDYAKAFHYVNHNKLENSSRDGNTRPPDLPLEKSVCRSRSYS